MLTAPVGSLLQLFSLPSAVLRFLSTPDHETFGLLLAPAQTWLSSFYDLKGDMRGKMGGGVNADLAKRAIRRTGRSRNFRAMS